MPARPFPFIANAWSVSPRRMALDLSRWNDVPVLEREQAIALGSALRASRVPERDREVMRLQPAERRETRSTSPTTAWSRRFPTLP